MEEKKYVQRLDRKRKRIPEPSLEDCSLVCDNNEMPIQPTDITIEPEQAETFLYHQESQHLEENVCISYKMHQKRIIDRDLVSGDTEPFQVPGSKEKPTQELTVSNEPQPSHELSNELQPSHELSNELQPSHELCNEPQLSYEHSELQPSHELSNELQPSHELSNKPQLSHELSNELQPSHELRQIKEFLDSLSEETGPVAGLSDTVVLSELVSTNIDPSGLSNIKQETEECFDIKEELNDFITEESQRDQETLGIYSTKAIFNEKEPKIENENIDEPEGNTPLVESCNENDGEKSMFSVTPDTFKVTYVCHKCQLQYNYNEYSNHNCAVKCPINEKHVNSKNLRCYIAYSPLQIDRPLLKSNRNPYQEFYNHFTMYHINIDNNCENRILSLSLHVEFLENRQWKPNQFYRCLECNHNCKNLYLLCCHFSSDHAKYKNNPDDMIRCKLCLKCHSDLEQMELHLKVKHPNFLNHRVSESNRKYEGEFCNFHQECEKSETTSGHGNQQKCGKSEPCGKNEQDEQFFYRCKTCENLFARCRVKQPFGDGFIEKESCLNFKHIDVYRIFVGGIISFKYKIKTIPNDHLSWRYSCVLCEPSSFFNSESQLNIHLKIIHGEDSVFRTCLLCGEKCYNMNQFYKHSQNICKNSELNFDNFDETHGLNSTKCDHCPLNFDTPCSTISHTISWHFLEEIDYISIDGKHTCPSCKVIFSDEKLFYAHCSPYSVLFINTTRFCDHCSISFNTSDEFKTHSIIKHDDQQCFKCKICGVSRELKLELNNHVSKEHNVQLIHCTKCSANVKVKGKLTMDHFKNCIKTDELNFICPICGLRFETLNILINHIKFDIQLLPTKEFQCKHCLNYFFTLFNLSAHMINTKCKSCNVYFCGKQKLTDHLKLQICA